MTSTIINFIVERYLANILEIDTSQTAASLWSGTVEMSNLKIKQEIFENLNLPYLELVNGYVGKLSLKMSMPRFYLYPIKVYVDKVFFHARQKNIDKLNQYEEIKGMESYKLSKLLNAEQLSDEVNQLKNESPGMVQQIINNLQIDIGEIIFRFDDAVSYPKVPFSLGIMLKRMVIQPTTDKFELSNDENITIPYSEINHKLIKIQDFSIYMDCLEKKEDIDYKNLIVKEQEDSIDTSLKQYLDKIHDFYSYCISELNCHMNNIKAHQYLLHLLNMDFRISLNENVKNGKPKAEVSLIFPKINLNINLKQVQTLFKVLAYINLNSYYRLGIAKDYYNKELKDDEKKIYMEQYVEYYKKKYVNHDKYATFPKELTKMEERLTYEQIQSMRSASLLKLNYLNSIEEIDKQIKTLEGAWFRVDHEKIAELKLERERILKTEQKVNSQIKSQMTVKKTVEVDEYFDLPDEYILYLATFTINECSFTIIENMIRDTVNNTWNVGTKLTDFIVDEFSIKGEIKKKGQFFSMGLGNLTITQERVKNKNFVNLVMGENTADKSSKLLYIEFENNPKFKNSNYRLKMTTERALYLIVNLSSIQYIQNKVLTAMSSSINFRDISSYAQGEVSKYIKSGYVDKYMAGDYQHFNIDLDISLKSPILVLPQNINDPENNNSIYMSLGAITMKSVLPPRQSLDIDYKTLKDESQLFDKYVIELTGVKMSTMEDGLMVEKYIGLESVLVKDFNFYIDMSMIIESKNPYYDNMIMKMSVDSFNFGLSEKQILFLIFYLENMYKEGNLLRKEIEEENKKNKEKDDYSEMDDIKQYVGKGPKEEVKEEKKEEEKPKEKSKSKYSSLIAKVANKEKESKGQHFSKISSLDDVKKMKKSFSFEFVLHKVKFRLYKNYPDQSTNEYLKFVLNTFSIETYISVPGDMLVNLKISNVSLYDNDLTESKKPVMTDTFKCLIASSPSKSQTSFIELSYLYVVETKKNETIMSMNNLVMCMSFNSLLRLYQFSMFYWEKYSEMTKRVNDLNSELAAQQILVEEKAAKIRNNEQRINNRFINGVKKYIATDLKDQKNMINKKLLEKNDNEEKRNEMLKKFIGDKKTKIEVQKSDSSFIFTMNHIEFNLPMDPMKDNTPILAFNFNLSYIQKFKQEVENTIIISTNKIVSQNYKVYKSDMNVLLYNVDFDVVYLLPKTFKICRNPLTERLLSNFRMAVKMKSYIIPKDEISVSNIDCVFEPIMMNFGFRQIRRLTEFYKASMKFLYKDMKEKYIPYVSFESASNGKTIELPRRTRKLNIKYVFRKAIQAEKIKKHFFNKLQSIQKKNEIITNLSKYNKFMDINLRIDKCSLTILDNTRFEKRVLLDVELTKMFMKYISNSDPSDGTNLGNAIIEMVSGKQIPIEQFNIQTLYQYINMSFSFETYYFNISMNEFEPFIEPFTSKLEIMQVAKMTRYRMDYTSQQMLNMNISANSLKVLNLFMTKYYEDESKWYNPIKESMFRKEDLDENLMLPLSKEENVVDNFKKEEEIILQFYNYTGVDVIFWFDSKKDFKNRLNDNEVLSYTKTTLAEAQGANASRNKILKDKFSFTLLDSTPITGIEFTCNNYTNFKINVNLDGTIREVELSVKVKTSGIIKSVIFEPSISIINDTFFEDVYISCGESEQRCSKGKRIKIPLTWMIREKSQIYAKFSDKGEKQLIYENALGMCIEENQKILVSQDDKKSKKKKDKNKEGNSEIFNFNNSKIITFNDKEKGTISLCFDYIAMRSTENERASRILEAEAGNRGIVSNLEFDDDDDETLLSHKIEKSYEYTILIRPCATFVNQIPFDLLYTIENENDKRLTSLQKGNLYNLIPTDDNTKIKVKVNYYDIIYTSEDFTLCCDMDTMVLTANDKKLVMKMKKTPKDLSKRFNNRLLKIAFHSTISTEYTFYFEYLITNRMSNALYLIPNDPKAKGKENKNEIIELTAKKVNPLSYPSKETKMMIKTDETSWSKPFDINTQGIDGVISLEKTIDIISTSVDKKKKENKYTTSTDIAILIASSQNYLNSTIVVFEQRYLLINNLSFDVQYKQEGEDISIKLPKDSQQDLIYQSKKRIYRINVGDNWSGPFDVDNVEDFDLKVKIKKEDKDKYQNVFTYDNENYYILIRVINQTYDSGLIYIMLTTPTYPYMEINNKTESIVKISENKKATPVEIQPMLKVPFIWESTLEISNNLYVEVFGTKKTFSFSKFDRNIYEVEVNGKKINCILSVGTKNNNNTRCLTIETSDVKENSQETVEKLFFIKKKPRMTRYNVSLKGMGLSIIDDTPREIFFISFYGIDINYSNNILTSKNQSKIENTENIIFYLKNFQIDYCLNDSFKNIISPKIQNNPQNEKYFEEHNKEIIPFISLLVTRQYTTSITNDEKIMKYPQIDFTMQEFNIKIEQFAVNSLIDVLNNYFSLLTFMNSNSKSDFIVEEPLLKPEVEVPLKELGSENENKNMLLINYLLISGLKFNLTLRIDISDYDVKLLPRPFMKVIGVLGNSLCRITDSPLRFKEMLYENVFIDVWKIISLLTQNYTKQGLMQVYKVLGSSDLIGNPTKLIDNIGTGFIELINEPRKGFLKGPTQFGKGLAKGIASLVSNVVGGTFDAVGKITGTLLTATQTLQGHKPETILDEEDEPENIIAGTFEGIKGGLVELGRGLSGIFLNPYRQAKTDGVKGFFKGLGTGLLGAVISPISAVLKLSNSIAVGVKNTATTFTRSPLKTIRFRHPRVIKENECIRSYDETFAEAKEIMLKLVGESTNNILYAEDFRSGDKGYGEYLSTVILTDRKLVVVYDMKKVIFLLKVKYIKDCKIHFVNNNYVLVFKLTNEKTRGFKLTESFGNVCCNIYNIFNEMIMSQSDMGNPNEVSIYSSAKSDVESVDGKKK